MEKTQIKDRVYTTPVNKKKYQNFLGFLRSLKIKKENIQIISNGDFYIFHIDLSDKNNTEFGHIRKILNKNQTSYL